MGNDFFHELLNLFDIAKIYLEDSGVLPVFQALDLVNNLFSNTSAGDKMCSDPSATLGEFQGYSCSCIRV